MLTTAQPRSRVATAEVAELLARRALAIALNARPGGRGPGQDPLGPADPAVAEAAIRVLEQRATPDPAVTLAIELLDRCARRQGR